MTGKQTKFLISGALIVLALVVWFTFVAGGASSSQAAYDISLKEFRARSGQGDGDDVRVRGKVEEGSIVQKPGSAEVSFNLTDAIRRHGNQARPARDAFNALRSSEKDDLIAFLLSL